MDLYEEQKTELFEGVLSLPNDEVLRTYTQHFSKRKEIEEKELDKFISKSLKDNMEKTLSSQGLTKEQIKEYIKNFAMEQKKASLQKHDALMKGING